MHEKILALLAAKFAQARKDGLAQLARSLAIQSADEAEAQALVEKLTSDKVTDFIKEWRKDVDAEVTNSNKTFETTLKSKFNFVEKTTPANPPADPFVEKTTPANPPADPNDMAAIIQRSVEAAMKPLQEKLTAFENGNAVATRKQVLEAKLAQAPEAMKSTILKNFSRMNFDTEEAFNEFVTETETDIATFVQDNANSGLGLFPRPAAPVGSRAAETQVLKDIEDWAKSTNPAPQN